MSALRLFEPTALPFAQMRSTNPYAFHSGEWALVIGLIEDRGRPCYLLGWPNGDIDTWPVEDTSDLERQFR